MGVRDEVLARLTVSEVIGEVVDLQARGNEYVACCPFHEEKTPSFTVNDEKGFYHCFGCGAHGNAIDFLIEHNGIDFGEALRQLAARAGVALGRLRKRHRQDDPLAEPRIWAKLTSAGEWFRREMARRGAALPPLPGGEESGDCRIGVLPPGQPGPKMWLSLLGQAPTPGILKRLPAPAHQSRALVPALDRGGAIRGVYVIGERGARWYGRARAPAPVLTTPARLSTPDLRRRERLLLVDDWQTWRALAEAGRPAAMLPWPACLSDVSPAVRGLLRGWREVTLVLSNGTGYLYDHPLLVAALNEYRTGMQISAQEAPAGQVPEQAPSPLEDYLIRRSLVDAGAHLPGGAERARRICRHWWRMLPDGLYRAAVGDRIRVALEGPRRYPGHGPRSLAQISHPLALDDRERQRLRIALEYPQAARTDDGQYPAAEIHRCLRQGRFPGGRVAGQLQAFRRHCPLPKQIRDPQSAADWLRRQQQIEVTASMTAL